MQLTVACLVHAAHTYFKNTHSHVNTLNLDPASWDPDTGEGAGVATNMTGIAEMLRRANYSTAAVGKWGE